MYRKDILQSTRSVMRTVWLLKETKTVKMAQWILCKDWKVLMSPVLSKPKSLIFVPIPFTARRSWHVTIIGHWRFFSSQKINCIARQLCSNGRSKYSFRIKFRSFLYCSRTIYVSSEYRVRSGRH